MMSAIVVGTSSIQAAATKRTRVGRLSSSQNAAAALKLHAPQQRSKSLRSAGGYTRAAIQYEPDEEKDGPKLKIKSPVTNEEGKEQEGITGDTVREAAEEAQHWVQDKWEKAMHQGGEEADSLQDKARDVKSKVQDTAHDLNARAKSAAHDVKSSAQSNMDKQMKGEKDMFSNTINRMNNAMDKGPPKKARPLKDQVVNKQPAWIRQFALATGVVILVAAVTTSLVVPFLRNFTGQ